LKLVVIFDALKETYQEWRRDNAQSLSASIAFYTIFSIAPLFVIAIAIAGKIFGSEEVRARVLSQFSALIGSDAAGQIDIMIRKADNPKSGMIATILGIVTLLLGAMGVFGQLKDAMNAVWNAVPPRRRGWWSFLRSRLISLAMVMGVAFLLLVSLLFSTAVEVIAKWAGSLLPTTDVWAIEIAHFVVSLGVITLLFGMIYKTLPDVRIAWKDVWVGAAATALLFNLGKFLIGLYLGGTGVGSIYGAAGSLVIILVWVYYSASLFLFGAEFTQVYAGRWGSRIRSRGSSGDPRGPEDGERSRRIP
jgi:membrane protein